MKKIFSLLIGSLCTLGSVSYAQNYIPKYELINSTEYPTLDIGVATYNVRDYDIDNTGTKDVTKEFQDLLNKLGDTQTYPSGPDRGKRQCGGILFVPEGKYKIKKLTIPKGVTLRGEWKKPVKGQPIKGTILMPFYAKGYDLEQYSFIDMEPSTEVSNVAVWYQDQDPTNIRKYPPTFLYGSGDYWGNDYCNVRHVTLVNSYIGIKVSSTKGGGCPNIYDVYGSPLKEGIVIDNIADVGRFEWLDFSPEYWSGSGLPNAPVNGEADSWIKENGTGIVMRRNDWSYTCNINIEGYNCGFHAQHSPAGVETAGDPNGHNYGFTLKNCATGVLVEGVSGSGIMFTRVNTVDCGSGIVVLPGVNGPVQFYDCQVHGKSESVGMRDGVSSKLLMQQCHVKGAVYALGGDFISNNGDFASDVHIGSKARTIFTGNRFSDGAKIDNRSLFECKVDPTATNTKPLPSFDEKYMKTQETKPARAALYVVTDAEFGATPIRIDQDLNAAADNTSAIQKALDKAKSEGGGIVYLPAGHYKMTGNLTIPTGVELKGSSDIATVPKGNGAVFEVYAGKGSDNGTPFITMERQSGLRGVTFNYPEQGNPNSVLKYPYCVRGAADIYIVNAGFRATYNALDLFTNKCDNHYVDYLAGHVFMNAIRIGGGSENGLVVNTQFNTIVYACGDEWKFGSWPNSIAENQDAAYTQNYRDFTFMILGDCTNQILYNDFHFGSNKGHVFLNDGNGGASGRSLGLGIDGSVNAVIYEALSGEFDMINNQFVALKDKVPGDSFFYITEPTFDREVTYFSNAYWGSGSYFGKLQGGMLNMIESNFNQSGSVATFDVSGTGQRAHITTATMSQVVKLVKTKGSQEKQVAVESSVLDPNNANTNQLIKWENNLSTSSVFANTEVLLNRTGWIATASHNSGNASRAIDSNADTRWDTGGAQASGQWFSVDMRELQTISAVILDTSRSPNDGPAGYEVSVSLDGKWEKVAEGKGGGSLLIVSFPQVTTQKIQVKQTGTKGNHWSIHEFNVALLPEDPTGLEENPVMQEQNIYYSGGQLHLGDELNAEQSIVELYNLSGQKILTAQVHGNSIEIAGLQRGLYIAVVKNNKYGVVSRKIIVNN